MRLDLIAWLSALAMASGCASGPAILVEGEGALPSGGFSLLADSDPAVAQVVSSRLEMAGLRASGQEAPFRIEVLRTRRPETAGAFTSEERPETANGWSISPTPRRWWRNEGEVRAVSITVLDGRSGERIAWARARSQRPANQTPDEQLAAEAAASLLSRPGPPEVK